MVCGNEECKKGGLICVEDECRCFNEHKLCCLYKLNQIIQRIENKRLNTQPLLDHINKFFDQLID